MRIRSPIANSTQNRGSKVETGMQCNRTEGLRESYLTINPFEITNDSRSGTQHQTDRRCRKLSLTLNQF